VRSPLLTLSPAIKPYREQAARADWPDRGPLSKLPAAVAGPASLGDGSSSTPTIRSIPAFKPVDLHGLFQARWSPTGCRRAPVKDVSTSEADVLASGSNRGVSAGVRCDSGDDSAAKAEVGALIDRLAIPP